MATTGSRSGCTITITVRIEFYGPGANQNLINGWETAIENLWNGRRYRCCEVVFNVITRLRGANDPPIAGFHQVQVVNGPQTSTAGLGPGSTSGTWDDLDTGNVVAHETGHLMGLRDEYHYDANGNYVNDNPQPSDPQSIMAQTWGNVDALQEHINAVVRKTVSWWSRLICRFCCFWRR